MVLFFIAGLMVDTVELGVFPRGGKLLATPDGSQWIYVYEGGVAMAGRNYAVRYALVKISPSGEHWLVVASADQGDYVITPGGHLGPFEEVADAAPTGRGPVVAYRSGRRWLLMGPDGEWELEGPVEKLVASSDGSRWAYVVESSGKYRVYLGTQCLGSYTWAGSLGLEGDTLIYAYEREGWLYIWLNGRKMGPYRQVGTPHLSGTGFWALSVEHRAKMWVLTPSGRYGPYTWLSDLKVATMGSSWAACDRPADDTWRVLWDGKAQGDYPRCMGLGLSPRGTALGFIRGVRPVVQVGDLSLGPFSSHRVWGPFLGEGIARVYWAEDRGDSWTLFRVDLSY